MAYQAVIFDLDGTLLDTLEDLADSYNHALTKYGFPTHTTDAYRYFVGDGAVACATRALPEKNRDDETVWACLAAFREYYARNWRNKTRPYDGVPEMLDALTVRGLKLAVLSNKTQEATERCVKGLLPDWRFDMIVGHRESLPRKPDPSGALEISAELDVAPAEFLFLGDTSVDMRTAVAAGMFPVGALWGFRTEQELLESGARVVIERGIDITNLL